MSEGDRSRKPQAPGSQPEPGELEAPGVPRKTGLFGASRMNAVAEERAEVSSSLARRMTPMRKEDATQPRGAAIPEGGGAPLADNVRKKMEPRLGADLSNVRVHAGGDSARAASDLGARAFTVGTDVHFNSGEFAPGSKEGDRLLAHELTHTVQAQRSGIQRKEDPAGGGHEDAAVSQPGEPAEQEADAVADKVTDSLHGGGKHGKGGAAKGISAAGPTVGRKIHRTPEGHGHGGHDSDGDGAEGAEGEHGHEHDKTDEAAGGEGHEQSAKGEHDGKDQKDGKGGGAQKDKKGKGKDKKKGQAHGGGDEQDKGASGEGGAHPPTANAGGAGAAHGAEPPPSGKQEGQPGAKPSSQAKPAGGEGGADAGATQQKAPPIAAKLSGIGRKIFRAPTNNANNNAGGANNNAGGGVNNAGGPNANANADPWQTYCNTLPADLKAKALALSPADQQPFKDTSKAHQGTFLALQTSAARLEFVRLADDAKGKVAVIVQNPADRDVYETKLSGAPRGVYRDLTPDERKDMNGVQAQMPGLLADPVKLDDWRKLRNAAALAANPKVAADLASAGQNPQQIVEALSSGQGGERLRRVIADPGFANEADKAGFILDVKSKLTGPVTDPFAAMKLARPNWVLRGKLATGDASFNRMPIMKAFPLANVWKYGTVPLDIAVAALETAPPTAAEVPRKPDGKVDKAAVAAKLGDVPWKTSTAKYVAAYLKSKGSLAGCDFKLSGGPGVPSAYWMYDQNGVGLLAPEKSGLDVSKILAVDENPDYQLGFAIVSLPDAIKNSVAANKGIRRPTAIDGLTFDQFAIADPSACYGVTSGGMNEVVVDSIMVSQTTVNRIC